MRIFFRLLLAAFLKNLLLCLLALLLLLLLSRIFQNVRRIVSSWEGFVLFMLDTLRAIPGMLEIALPLCVLLAVVITMTGLSRSSELVAMKSAGMSTLGLAKPLLFVLIPISALTYLNQNYLIPALHSPGRQHQRHEWHSDKENIYYFKLIDSQKRIVRKGYIFRWLSDPFRVSETVSFAAGRLAGEVWTFKNVLLRRQVGEVWVSERAPRLKISAQHFPAVFRPLERNAHHMPFFALYRELGLLEKRSPLFFIYLAEAYQKISALFTPFVMVLIGLPLAQSYNRRSKASGEIVLTVLGGVLFWIGSETLLVLGKGGVLHPFIAAWGLNIVFGLFGLSLLLRAR